MDNCYFNPHISKRSQYTQRYFTAICNENTFESHNPPEVNLSYDANGCEITPQAVYCEWQICHQRQLCDNKHPKMGENDAKVQ